MHKRLRIGNVLGCLLFLLSIAFGSLLLPQQVNAQVRADAFRYQYVVAGNGQLKIRAYLPDHECGDGNPPGTSAIQFATMDGVNFGAEYADFGCMDGSRRLENNRGQVTDIGDIFTITIGESEGRGQLRGSGWPTTNVDVAQVSLARNWKTCVESGDDVQACVDELIATAQDSEEEPANCNSSGFAMSWVMCPVVKAIEESLKWVDEQIQKLLEVDQTYYNNDAMRNAFGNIRNIAYTILVPIVLVMVISTALGFDFISAYTVKRALPRLIIATIFIALSFEICMFLIQFTNALGRATLGIITGPFSQGSDINGLSLSTLFAGGLIEGVLTGAASIVALIIVLWLFGGTLLLFAAIAFLVLMLRQMFIVVLMLAAPLAILAWIFPGNDKMWKLWWGSFSKLLLMFPLIMAVIAVGRIFAYTIHYSSGGGLEGSVMQPLMTLLAYMIPYALIPFTFKFAGGMFATVSGMVNDRSKGLFDRQRKSRARKYEKGQRIGMQYRAGANRSLMDRASSTGRLRGLAYRGLARGVGGRDLEAKMSAYTAEEGKKVQEQIATGIDSDIRGSTVNLKAARASTAARQHQDANGNWQWDNTELESALMRESQDGTREYKSLGGAWVKEADVINGHKRFGRNRFAQQAALSYEMRKAMTDGQVSGVSERYADLAKDQWGMSDTEAGGAWIGAAFENQNQHLEYKYTSHNFGEGSRGPTLRGKALADEIYEKRGSYQMSQMSAHTVQQLNRAYADAEAASDEETMQKVRSIAETFMTRYGSGGGVVGMDDETPIQAPAAPVSGAAASGGEVYRTQTQGAGHVAEEVRKLAVNVGVYGPRDPSTDSRSTHGPYVDPRHD